jgi:hypothetical protein
MERLTEEGHTIVVNGIKQVSVSETVFTSSEQIDMPNSSNTSGCARYQAIQEAN